MKTPLITKLNNSALIVAAASLPTVGRLAISENKLVYLDIDDGYIHQLFPLLQTQNIQKPDYFGEQSAGAHITVIYPEENTLLDKQDLAEGHRFHIDGVFTAVLGLKKYYVLMVTSPSLLQLRRRYGLADMLLFKNYSICFHITIASELLAE